MPSRRPRRGDESDVPAHPEHRDGSITAPSAGKIARRRCHAGRARLCPARRRHDGDHRRARPGRERETPRRGGGRGQAIDHRASSQAARRLAPPTRDGRAIRTCPIQIWPGTGFAAPGGRHDRRRAGVADSDVVERGIRGGDRDGSAPGRAAGRSPRGVWQRATVAPPDRAGDRDASRSSTPGAGWKGGVRRTSSVRISRRSV